MRKIIIIALFSFLCFNNIFALEKKDVQAYIDNSFAKLTSLGADFTDLNNKLNSGYIKAMKGNKYRINSRDRVIVCDGKKIWNYSIKDNKVLISKFDNDRNSLSLENIFFDILKNSKLKTLKKETSTNKNFNKLYAADFEISEADKQKYKVDKLKIMLDEQKNIKYLIFNYKSESQQIQVNFLSLNKKMKDSDFKFKAPKKCEVIELD